MSARASVKQQELEEQLARLLPGMMELQQQRQEQLCSGTAARQEEEQFGRLLEELQQQGKLLNARLRSMQNGRSQR